MGLLDVLNGMMNGPRGAPGPTDERGGGGMSPILMALLGLLAYKAWKHRSQSREAPPDIGRDQPPPPANMPSGQGGGLGDLLGGMFGGGPAIGQRPGGGASPGGGLGDLLGPAAAGGVLGSVLGDGLRRLVNDMQTNGHGRAAQSWISTGPNEDISENDLANAIGAEDIDRVAEQTGMPRDQLLSELRRYLPGTIDELTPRGQLPSEDESLRWI